jgi:hypothetical protein
MRLEAKALALLDGEARAFVAYPASSDPEIHADGCLVFAWVRLEPREVCALASAAALSASGELLPKGGFSEGCAVSRRFGASPLVIDLAGTAY